MTLNLSGKFEIVYADPPWSYPKTGGTTNSRGMAKQFYKTMSKEEIKAIKVSSILAENCLLFLWSTFPKLPEAIEVISAWGFEYIGAGFIWIKKTRHGKDFVGMGYWTRANPEVCLLAKKGKPKPLRHDIRQLFYSEIQKHSKKPDGIRKLIVDLCGDIPRIELFAREKSPGWDSWGNEINAES